MSIHCWLRERRRGEQRAHLFVHFHVWAWVWVCVCVMWVGALLGPGGYFILLLPVKLKSAVFVRAKITIALRKGMKQTISPTTHFRVNLRSFYSGTNSTKSLKEHWKRFIDLGLKLLRGKTERKEEREQKKRKHFCFALENVLPFGATKTTENDAVCMPGR